MKKIRVGILFGGHSAEHEVSLQSAKNIIEAIDKTKYEVIPIGIDRQGRWYLNESSQFLLDVNDPAHIHIKKSNVDLALVPGSDTRQIRPLQDKTILENIDVVFPALHGPYGEDGTVQGLLKLANIPFVGADVLGSAVSMDKVIMKRLLREAGLPQAKFHGYRSYQIDQIDFDQIESQIGIPCFVKPANLGSSVGITKVHNKTEFYSALTEAFRYDDKLIIEEFISGREIECAVLGNEDPIASVPGEVIPKYEFYSYEAKYLDEKGAELIIPADLPVKIISNVQELSIKTFKALDVEGMGRVDFFLTDNQLFVNEINTIPGFTKISMYPKLWEASGISYSKLIDRLIQLSIKRYEHTRNRNNNSSLKIT